MEKRGNGTGNPGSSGSSPDCPFHSHVSPFTSSGQSWKQRFVAGPSPRSWHVMCFDDHRQVTVLYGGFDGMAAFNQTWEWDGQHWTLRTADGPLAGVSAAMCFDKARGVALL